jgi:hypothetical protein
MNECYEQFKTIMEENTNGHEVEIRYGEPISKIYPAVRLFTYTGFPKPGLNTIVTYGISLANHKNWVSEKPELMLTINSMDKRRWLGLLGLFSDVGRDESAFDAGSCFAVNYRISEDSAMQGFCIGEAAKLPVNPIVLTDRRVIIRMAIPIYIGESEMAAGDKYRDFLKRIGESRFHDVKRPDLSGGPGIHPSKVQKVLSWLGVKRRTGVLR